MKNMVITIGAEHGSGGPEIGRALANALGIEYYNRDLIDKVVEQIGIDRDLVAQADKDNYVSYEVETSFGPRYLNLTNKVINTQFEVIRKMAEHSCVIIGRCSDYILQERDNVTNIYIYAPEDVRIRTVMEQEDLSESKARQIVKDKDVFLHRRYKYITGTYRSDRHNRHLLIDSSVLGWDRTAKYLQAFIEMKYEG